MYMNKQSTHIMESTMESTVNQRINSARAMNDAFCELGGVLTPAAAARNSKLSNWRTERRSSRGKKGTATNFEMLSWAFNNTPAKVFYLGRKSDFVASAEPTDRKHTIVMIDGIPHKKSVTGGYKALTLQPTDEQGVTEMYQYLLLLAESGPMAAADYVVLLQEAGF